jgi:hypothetical protein
MEMRKTITRGERPIIRMAPGIRQLLLNSICRHTPEHYAILAGNLGDPHRVTDCRPMPPMLGHDGRFNRSGGHVQLNDSVIEYYINMELLPAGKYVLGVIHTHPSNLTHLSGGIADSGHGDLPSIRAALERAAQAQKNWKDFLAPVVTMDSQAGTPTFTGWIVRLDQPAPIASDIVFEEGSCGSAEVDFPIEEWMAPYLALVKRVRADRRSSTRHKRWMTKKIYECMRADVSAKFEKHPATSARAYDRIEATNFQSVR